MLSEIFDLLNTFFCFASSWIRYAPRMSGRGCRCQSSGGHQRGQNRGLAQDKQRDSVEMRTLFFPSKTKISRLFKWNFSHESTFSSRIVHLEGWIFHLRLGAAAARSIRRIWRRDGWCFYWTLMSLSMMMAAPQLFPCCAAAAWLFISSLLCGFRIQICRHSLMIVLHTWLHMA